VLTDYPNLRNKSVIDETHTKILSALHAYTAGIIIVIIIIFITIILIIIIAGRGHGGRQNRQYLLQR